MCDPQINNSLSKDVPHLGFATVIMCLLVYRRDNEQNPFEPPVSHAAHPLRSYDTRPFSMKVLVKAVIGKIHGKEARFNETSLHVQ